MKNRLFRFLSLQERQKILAFVLREKTDSGLTAEEEAGLLSELTSKSQFHIRVFTRTDAYLKATAFANVVNSKIVFGAVEIEKIKASGGIPGNAIAIVAETTENPEGRNQVYIFIPPYRKCGLQCVNGRIGCEHLVPNGNNSTGCDLYKFLEVPG